MCSRIHLSFTGFVMTHFSSSSKHYWTIVEPTLGFRMPFKTIWLCACDLRLIPFYTASFVATWNIAKTSSWRTVACSPSSLSRHWFLVEIFTNQRIPSTIGDHLNNPYLLSLMQFLAVIRLLSPYSYFTLVSLFPGIPSHNTKHYFPLLYIVQVSAVPTTY